MPPTPAARRQQKGNWVLRHLPGNAGRPAGTALPRPPPQRALRRAVSFALGWTEVFFHHWNVLLKL